MDVWFFHCYFTFKNSGKDFFYQYRCPQKGSLHSYSGSLSILIHLDLSAAFNAVNHHILLVNRLKNVFSVSETVLTWFRSYLTDRQQFVYMNGSWSEKGPIRTGVPQGSILGPSLFSIYIFPLGLLLRSLELNYICMQTTLRLVFILGLVKMWLFLS